MFSMGGKGVGAGSSWGKGSGGGDWSGASKGWDSGKSGGWGGGKSGGWDGGKSGGWDSGKSGGKGDKGGKGSKGGSKGWSKGGGDAGGKKGAGKGKVAMKIAAGEELYSGIVRAWLPEKKHGYISCDAIKNLTGLDVYIYQDVLESCKAGPGDMVSFFIHWSAKGQPQASSPLIRLSGGDASYALKGTYKEGKEPEKGFGFVQCTDTKEFFGRDVYVNKDLASTVTPGQTVSFNAFLNRDGMPNAQAMEPCEEMWEATPGDLSLAVDLSPGTGGGGGGGGGGKGWGGGGKGWGGGGGGPSWGGDWDELWNMMMAMGGGGAMGSKGPKGGGGKSFGKGGGKSSGGGGKSSGGGGGPPTPTGKAFTGVIKSFNEANNYGFIECPEVKQEYGFDVFVHGKELSGQQSVGEAVYFELGINSKGQPQAMKVQGVDAAGGEPPAKKMRLGEEGGHDSAFQDFGTFGEAAGDYTTGEAIMGESEAAAAAAAAAWDGLLQEAAAQEAALG